MIIFKSVLKRSSGEFGLRKQTWRKEFKGSNWNAFLLIQRMLMWQQNLLQQRAGSGNKTNNLKTKKLNRLQLMRKSGCSCDQRLQKHLAVGRFRCVKSAFRLIFANYFCCNQMGKIKKINFFLWPGLKTRVGNLNWNTLSSGISQSERLDIG